MATGKILWVEADGSIFLSGNFLGEQPGYFGVLGYGLRLIHWSEVSL